MTQQPAGTVTPRRLRTLIARAARAHGPALNVIHRPTGADGGRCLQCHGRGPVSVHEAGLVWLLCGHTQPLPPTRRKWSPARHVAAPS